MPVTNNYEDGLFKLNQTRPKTTFKKTVNIRLTAGDISLLEILCIAAGS